MVLAASLSYDAVTLHLGQCEKRLRYVKLATSSIIARQEPYFSCKVDEYAATEVEVGLFVVRGILSCQSKEHDHEKYR